MSDASDKAARPGTAIFAALFVLFALFLLSQLTAETKFSSNGQLFAQPRFWPAVGVVGMAVFGLAHLVKTWRMPTRDALAETLTWLRALEYLAWFMVYVAVVPVIGYLAATVIFTVGLAIRQGYRTARELLLAAGLGIAIVMIFKSILQVRIPGGSVYEFLPGALRNIMIVYF